MQQAEVVELYNKGLQYIKAHDYERAKELLKGIALVFHDRFLIQKVIGSLEMMTGYPYLALKYWEPLIDKDVGVTEEQCELLRKQLPIYDRLQDTYSKAMQWVIIGQLKDAEHIMSELFQSAGEVPIPTEMYRTYIFILLQIGKGQRALETFRNAPQYVQLVPEMRVLEVAAKKLAKEEENVQPLTDPWLNGSQSLTRSEKKKLREQEKGKRSIFVWYNVSVVAVLFIVILAFLAYGKQWIPGLAPADTQQEVTWKKQVDSLEKQLEILRAEKATVVEQKDALNDELVSLAKQLEGVKPQEEQKQVSAVPSPKPEENAEPKVQPEVEQPATSNPLPKRYKIQRGDTLSSISMRYYKTKKRASNICSANARVIANCDNLPVGRTITIP